MKRCQNRRQAEEAAWEEKQDGYYKQMIVLGEKSIALFESMPEYLKSAEEYLDEAEFDFSDGAFAPFWDSLEKTAKKLGRFDEGVQEIKTVEYKPEDFRDEDPLVWEITRKGIRIK